MTGRLVWQGRTAVDGRSELPAELLGNGVHVVRISDGIRSVSAPFAR